MPILELTLHPALAIPPLSLSFSATRTLLYTAAQDPRERSHGPQSRALVERVARTYFRLTARNPLETTPFGAYCELRIRRFRLEIITPRLKSS